MKIRKYFVGLVAMLGMLAIGFSSTGVLNKVFAASEDPIDTEAELKSALVAGGEVTLQSNIKVNEMIEIPAGVTTTLDLNGFEITSAFQTDSDSKHIYPLNNFGNLVIKDSVGTGLIQGRGIYNQEGATLTVNEAKIVSEDWNGGATAPTDPPN